MLTSLRGTHSEERGLYGWDARAVPAMGIFWGMYEGLVWARGCWLGVVQLVCDRAGGRARDIQGDVLGLEFANHRRRLEKLETKEQSAQLALNVPASLNFGQAGMCS